MGMALPLDLQQAMARRDIHQPYDFFEYVRLDDGSAPAADATHIDVALLDMNHHWPNLGHDSLVHVLLEAAESLRDELVQAGLKVRVLSHDVRRALQVPDPANDRFQLYLGTGGPGHLDPRLNDGVSEFSQGINESSAWEAPLFRLFDSILASESSALFAVCHTFGLVCRWSGVARPELRREKSSGMPQNALSNDALMHPWFSQFADDLADHRHFRVVDNRLFDLVVDELRGFSPIAFESEASRGLTMIELARTVDGMPRIFGVNHHPEIIDREHILTVLEEKQAHGEVTAEWYRERADTMRELFQGERERQSQLTSYYTLTAPLQHQLQRIVSETKDRLALA